MEHSFYNVRDFGAIGDGKTLDTAAIQAALDACKTSGGTVLIPEGEYLTSSLRIYSNTALKLEDGARLIADTDEAHYGLPRGKYDTEIPRDAKSLIGIEDNGALGGLEQLILSTKRGRTDCIIFAEDAENVSITGGEINGNAEHFFTITESGRYKPHLFRPQMMFLKRCRGVCVQSTRLMNAAYYNIRAIECEDTRFEGLTIETSLSYINSDGINIAACKGVLVSDCRIQTGDDCIAISNGEFTPLTRDCEDITVSSCTGRTHANLIRVFNGIEADLAVDIGIGGEAQLAAARKHAVRNVSVSDCTLEEGCCAINMVGVFGKIEDVAFSDIIAKQAKTAIFMVIQKEGSIRDVTIRSLSCQSAAGLATIQGTTKDSISGVRIENCDFYIAPRARVFGNGLIDPLILYCLASSAPYNLYIRHASDVSVINTRVRWDEESLRGIEKFAIKENRPPEYEHLWRENMMPSDKFPCIDAYDLDGLKIEGLDATGYRGAEAVRTKHVDHLS